MAWLLVVFALVSSASFLFYGYQTLVKQAPRDEFARYKMAGARRIVGTMQLFGGAGVLLGIGFGDDATVLMAAIALIRAHIRDEHIAAARETLKEEIE